ncbi:hypothetical protein LOTGIDRAFT_172977 [Lottia gigantea]|uniref:Methyltransferase domain-containing protein n=1 Tax=Lottia gigantea TaxID=225164 RepID=V4AUB4_LOTGI|nr:hypothetical protein LOTGIDRAFT_172977 [Lottia gigantea]ESP00878.1 hypothetical protein LOTGIDRAFT_172977 [Lottia gigantea]
MSSLPRCLYVKEILGCLATSRIIEIDENSEKYFVMEELRPILKTMSITANLLTFCNQRKDDIIELLDINGPNGYCVHSKTGLVLFLGYCVHSKTGFGGVLTARRERDIDSLIQIELFQDTPDLKDKLESGLSYVEYGSGEGAVILEMAKRFPKSQFTAVDYSTDAISVLQQKILDQNLTNVQGIHGDLHDLPSDWSEKYDVAYIRDVIHDVGDPVKATNEIVRSVKRGGVVSITEVAIKGSNQREQRDDPVAPQFYLYSTCICVPESLNQPGGVGLGCTSGQEKMSKILMEGGIPKDSLEMYFKSAQNIVRYVYRK